MRRSTRPDRRHLLNLTCRIAGVLALSFTTTLAQTPGSTAPVPTDPVTADGWAERGRQLHAEGSLFPALEAFDHAVATDTSRTDIRTEYASLLKSAGFWLRSAAHYKAVLAVRPGEVLARMGYGELLNAEYQFAAAVDHFRQTLAMPLEAHDRERTLVGLSTAQFGLADFKGAAATLEGLLNERPRVLAAMAFLAISRRKMGELDGALKVWEEFLALQPNVSRAKLHRIELQELRQAIAVAREAAEASPANPEAWAWLGRMLRRQPDLPGAAAAFEAAIRLAPSRADLRLALGCVLRDQGRWAEAARHLDRAGDDPVSGPLALYNLAFCARKAGDRAAETRAWKRAVALGPGDLYAYRRWLRLLPGTGALELERARLDLGMAEAARSIAQMVLSHVQLALVQRALGEEEAARELTLAAVRLDPNDVQAQRLLRDLVAGDSIGAVPATEPASPADWLQKGAVDVARGHQREAERSFRQAMEGESERPRAMVALASVLRAAGRDREAIELLEQARTLAPGYLYAHLDRALALSAAGRHAEAIEAAGAAVGLAPRSPLPFTLLATALHESGDTPGATQALERAVALDPMDDLGAPRLLLARMYGTAGKILEARDALSGDVPQDPEEMYRLAWEFVRDTYVDRTFNKQAWSDWQHRFDGRLRSPHEALAAISLMLASLDDRNTLLRSPDQTANMMLTLRTEAAEFSPTGIALTTSRSVEAKRLDGNVGYIAITNLFDPSVSKEIRKAAESVKGADAVILDLRGNQGGADSEADRIAAMFVEPGTETGKVLTPAGEVTRKAEAPPDGDLVVPPSKPMVVLVDHNTASSAESLAGSLREADRATLVGETTHGKAGVQSPLLLPGGTIVLVVNAEHADMEGNRYTGRGLRPDVPVAGAIRETAAPGQPDAEDPALRKAREILERKKRKTP